MKKIIAIGGGGFTNQTDKDLDKFVIDQCNKKKIKIGFLPTASKDDPKKIGLFYKRFSKNNYKPSHFSISDPIDSFKKWALNNHIIYVGGGNTAFLVNFLKKNNLIKHLKKAYMQGVILSGVSAGASCWFDWALSDSLGRGLKPLKGIGFIRGSLSPHASEKKRKIEFKKQILKKKLPPGISIDDGVGVLFVDGVPRDLYCSRKNHTAYLVNKYKNEDLKNYIEKNGKNIAK